MATINADVSMDVVHEVSTLGVVADEDNISDIEEEDFPSASEVVAALILGDMSGSQSAPPPRLILY